MGLIPIQQFGGSGLDIDKMVEAVTRAETDPQLHKVKVREDRNQIELSCIGRLQSMVFSTAEIAQEITEGKKELQWVIENSSPQNCTLEFDNINADGCEPGVHRIVIQALASQQRLLTGTFRPGFKLGNGELTIKTPAGSSTINIDQKMTLHAIASAINKATSFLGINAIVLQDEADEKLLISSRQLGKNSSITVSGTGEGVHLARSLKEIQPASDSKLNIDGVEITSQTNDVASPLIPGFKLKLYEADPEKTTIINVQYHSEVLKHQLTILTQNINEMVELQYNIREFPNQEGTSMQATIRNIQRDIAKFVTAQTPINNSNVLSFAELGLGTQKDGKLVLDENMYNKMAQRYQGALHTWLLSKENSLNTFASDLKKYSDVHGTINQKKQYYLNEYAELQQQKQKIQAKEAIIHNREMSRYQKMDYKVGKLKALGDHMEMLNNIRQNNKNK